MDRIKFVEENEGEDLTQEEKKAIISAYKLNDDYFEKGEMSPLITAGNYVLVILAIIGFVVAAIGIYEFYLVSPLTSVLVLTPIGLVFLLTALVLYRKFVLHYALYLPMVMFLYLLLAACIKFWFLF